MKMNWKNLLALLATASGLCAGAIETSIAYQGVLRDAQGAALGTQSHQITFRLYTQATAGTPLWARMKTVNLDAEGLFNVELNDSGTSVDGATYTTLSEALSAARGGSLYVGLEVKDSAGEILPRQKILMTPYASWAADVSQASGAFTVGGKATLRETEVASSLTVGGTSTVKGSATFAKDVTVSGNLQVKSTGALSGYGTIPIGGIIMWSGSTVPDGWALCDGEGGRPNLLNRFVMGVQDKSLKGLKTIGGAESVTLSVNQIPPHDHVYAGDDNLLQVKGASNYTKKHSTPGGYDAKSDDSGDGSLYYTSKTGAGQPVSILPPYYRLAFIIRVK